MNLKQLRRSFLVLGLVYLLILILGVVLLYALVPTEVWRSIWTVYFSGHPEDF